MKKRLIILCAGLCLLAACGTAAPAATPAAETQSSTHTAETPTESVTETKNTSSEKETTESTAETKPTEEVRMSAEYNVITEVVEIPNGKNTVYGTLYTPECDNTTPLIIMCHGYNGVGDDFKAEGMYFAKNGIATYTLDFCGGSTRSKSTGETVDMTIFTEKSDLMSAYEYFKTQEKIDTNNIFLFGGSQGGLVTTLVTEELGDAVAGMALYFPALCIPDNWRSNYPDTSKIPESQDFWGMKLGKNFFVSIHDFYIFDEIGSYPNNVLILHGDKDPIVPLSYSQKAVELYPHAELIVMENEEHGFKPEAGKVAREKVLAFLLENIR